MGLLGAYLNCVAVRLVEPITEGPVVYLDHLFWISYYPGADVAQGGLPSSICAVNSITIRTPHTQPFVDVTKDQ